MSDLHRFKISISYLRRMAQDATSRLNGLNGDPSSRANWLIERQLAHAVIALLDRIDSSEIRLAEPIEVPQ